MELRYGVRNALKSTELLEKSRKTCFKNHGVYHNSHSEKIQNKSKKTRIKRNLQTPDHLLRDNVKIKIYYLMGGMDMISMIKSI